MAQRKKRATLRRGKSAVRGKSLKASKSARKKGAKQSAGKPMSRKRLAKAKPKRARAKKVLTKDLQPTRPQSIPVRETLIVDVIEEPVPGVITVTEFEETDVGEAIVERDQLEED